MRLPVSLLLLGASLAACAACNKDPGTGASAPEGQSTGDPVETRPPNATGQMPAFPGQTRAPGMTADVEFKVRTIVGGLEHPWSVAFLPNDTMLITERPGRLRILATDGSLGPALAGLPEVDARDQGGLFDIVLDPEFADNGRIYWSYAEPRKGGNGTAVARGRLVRGEAARVEDVEVIWRMTPTLDSTMHFGGRLVFGRDGNLFITTGERSILEGRQQAQQLDSALGKTIRVRPDGSVPADNPLVGRADALPELWSWGHRNLQGAALHPETGQLWVIDHGPKGGDEINAIEKGADYGWPTITYGEEYSGGPVGEGLTAQEGMAQPLYYWDPSIAPSGMAFYDAALFPAWRGSLFVGALAGKHLARLTLEDQRIVGEERLLAGEARIRDVKVGPDGAIYLLTDEEDGELLALVPGT